VSSAAPGRHVLLKALGFSVALVLVFTLTANLLPQVQGEGAPKETKVDVGSLTLDSFVALGKSVFHGKGTCTLCHNDRGRAPDIPALDMVAEAKKQIADPRYEGKAKNAAAYLRESMLAPSAFVVAGFGQKGSHDTVSPMPVVDKPPIDLSSIEIDALIAYLEAKDGNAVTVPLPSKTAAPAATKAAAKPVAPPPAPAKTAAAALTKYGCSACHSLAGDAVIVGPPLAHVGASLDAAAIRQSILDPNAVIHEGFPAGVMPKDFADRMSAGELERIVRYLASKK